MKTIRWLVAISSVVLTATLSLAATAPGTTPPATKVMSQKELNANAWEIYTTNYGPFVMPQGSAIGGFWNGPYGYICGAGLWVGGINSDEDTIVAVGYNCNNGDHEFSPVSIDDCYDYFNYLSDPKARVYISTDSVDYLEWPIRDNEGHPVIQSNQDSYARYNDLNPIFTFLGDTTLGVFVEQTSYAYTDSSLKDIVFFHFTVKNISGKRLNNVYIGPCVDSDIGDEGGDPNDRTGFDYTRNLAMQYQDNPEPGWPETGVVGFRLLASPVNNTGDTVYVIDNEFSHNIAPGDTLGLTAFKIFNYVVAPGSDEERYLEMTGVNYWDMLNDAYAEWGAAVPEDKRFMMSSGPFKLEPDSTVDICFAVMAALDTVTLKAFSDTAQQFYNDNALGVFSNNDNPNITVHNLLPNAPNPFGHSGTTISYQIGGNGSTTVSLKIYNITGQLVKTLVNDNKTPGYYNTAWNGKADNGQKVSAGIYIYRLQAGEKNITRKMVLIK